MTWETAEAIADALLYEGYLLYPYRGSAVKNRYRWQFGVVGPGTHDVAPMQTQCVIERGADPVLDLKIRFLQVEARIVERLVGAPDLWEPVEAIVVDGRELGSWDEAHARELAISGVSVKEPFDDRAHSFLIEGGREIEIVRDDAGDVTARVVREQWPIACTIRLAVEPAGDFRKLTVRIENVTPWEPATGADADRPAALRRSLVGVHTLLAISDGAFVSLLDPPAEAVASVAACTNLRTWPVLVGQPPERTLMLSAPIILYDYPAVAPESPGDFFDGTEIDELLTLRVLTLTDAEREEAMATDPRARQILERAATLPPRALERLHGAIRSFDTVVRQAVDTSSWEAFLNPPANGTDEALDAAGNRITKGARVRLSPHPDRRADAMDMFLAGQTATVAEVLRDVEDQVHIAVIPIRVHSGNSAVQQSVAAGERYFYFRPDEIEVLDEPAADLSPPPRVLVAGIGNMFLGDDGFGCAVIQRLASRRLPDWVKVEDFGIRSIHLAYELLGASPAYDTTIIVDAVSRGGAPGTLYVLEPDVDAVPMESPDAHALSVESVLSFLKHLGGKPGHVLVVGCETASVSPEMGLSDSVAAALDGAADLVMKLIAAEERQC